MDWIITCIVEAVAIIFSFGYGYRELKELPKKASQEGLEAVKEKINRLETQWDNGIISLMTKKKSPLTLSDYAKQVLNDIQFQEIIFPKIKDELLAELEKYTLRTAYDVQEKALFVVRKFRDDPLYDDMKKAIYATGNNLDEVLAAIFIPLRDYYFEKYPEIKDSIEFLVKLEKEYKALGDFIISFKKQFSLDDNNKENLNIEILESKSAKTTLAFVLDYLIETKKEWNASEIAKALLNQGIQTTSKDFPRMIRSILSQLEKKGKITRENGKWKSI